MIVLSWSVVAYDGFCDDSANNNGDSGDNDHETNVLEFVNVWW